MEWDEILVAYDEIALKSGPVRSKFIQKLVRNIEAGLGDRLKWYRKGGRIFLKYHDLDKIAEFLPRVFGIAYFAKCVRIKLEDLERFINEKAEELVGAATTFAIRARREGSHNFTSKDIEVKLGELVRLRTNVRVDLRAPERTIYVEIRNGDCYVYNEILKGPRGLPLGTAGKVVCLISGGIDSPVAAWMMMKRGCAIVPLFAYFPRGGDESDLRRYLNVIHALEKWSIGEPIEAYVYRHEHNLLAFRKLEPKYVCVLCRRMMYRVANELAKKVGAKAIVTGENLAQVASQTLFNLSTIDSASELPVLRPLIGMDKIEIEKIAKEIGTYDISCQRISTGCLPRKGCWARPPKPVTMARLEVVKTLEEQLDIEELLNKSVESIKTSPTLRFATN